MVSSLVACKKAAKVPGDHSGNRTQLSLDSVYLYAQQTYLWNDALPSFASFNPARYLGAGAERSALENEIFDLSQFKLDPLSGFAYEQPLFAGVPKYSYLADQGNAGAFVAMANSKQTENNLGLGIAASGSLIFVSFVNPGSPAFNAGLERGDRLLEIDGQPATAILAEKMVNSGAAVLTYQRQGQDKNKVNLAKAVYEDHGAFKIKMLQNGQKHIAYLALGRFSNLSVSKQVLDDAFAAFAPEQPQQLVLDLRYNGGGYVETAEYLANLIAASSLNGKVIYTEHFNSMLRAGQTGILKNQPYLSDQGQPVEINGRLATMADVNFSLTANTHTFKKQGPIESLKDIFFIVGPGTASASELLINSLKPYFKVRLVGSRTYGKPVGFFGINIDKYTLYLTNFEIKNALGEGGYYNGFIPDLVVADDVTRNFGDVEEQCLAAAMAMINGGSGHLEKINLSSPETPRILRSDGNFKGMLKNRLILKF